MPYGFAASSAEVLGALLPLWSPHGETARGMCTDSCLARKQACLPLAPARSSLARFARANLSARSPSDSIRGSCSGCRHTPRSFGGLRSEHLLRSHSCHARISSAVSASLRRAACNWLWARANFRAAFAMRCSLLTRSARAISLARCFARTRALRLAIAMSTATTSPFQWEGLRARALSMLG